MDKPMCEMTYEEIMEALQELKEEFQREQTFQPEWEGEEWAYRSQLLDSLQKALTAG